MSTTGSTTGWLTRTWQHRLSRGGTALRRSATIIGLTACTIVALHTIWAWITDTPIDIAGPARATVNRTDYVKAYAERCLTRLLTATQDQRGALADCWNTTDLQALPTTAPVVVDFARTTKIAPTALYSQAEQWQVVIEVSGRPYPTAAPHSSYHQLSVLFTKFGLRAVGLPASVNGGGSGATLPLAYPVALPVGRPDGKGGTAATGNPLSDSVSGFLSSYLTAAGGLERYVSASSGLRPLADCTAVHLLTLIAGQSTPDHTTPAEGTTVHVLATVSALAHYAPRPEQYPLALTVTSGRWTVTGIDPGPAVQGAAEPSPLSPAP